MCARVVLAAPPSKTRQVVCTLGPSCWSKDMLVKMIDAGMNVARLNFSHGDHPTHARTVANLRLALRERPGTHVAVMLDTKGPEIRTGFFADDNAEKKITLEKGQRLELTTDYGYKATPAVRPPRLACSYAALCTSVAPGQKILAADGSLIMAVRECKPDEGIVVVEVLNPCTLGERKNMNLPGVVVDLPTITEKDRDDLVNFGLTHQVDLIAASFVRKASDIEHIRDVLGPRGRMIKIVAKIENQEGLQNYDSILATTDGVMVARGDLGMEIPPEKVFLAQKMMVRKANVHGKFVITATQMLESMIGNPRPTRAECTDVANAVLDGTDCVMLSGETAGGDYPLEAVTMMSKICVEAEGAINYPKLYLATRNTVVEAMGEVDTPEAIASSSVKTAIDMGAKMLIVLTETGRTAGLVAKYRPSQPVIVLTANGEVARQVEGTLRGCVARVVGSMIGTDSILHRAVDIGKELGWVHSGDAVIAIHGMIEARTGATNMLKVLLCD